jgi:hypothetical protein
MSDLSADASKGALKQLCFLIQISQTSCTYQPKHITYKIPADTYRLVLDAAVLSRQLAPANEKEDTPVTQASLYYQSRRKNQNWCYQHYAAKSSTLLNFKSRLENSEIAKDITVTKLPSPYT